jgi:hypothetical protein
MLLKLVSDRACKLTRNAVLHIDVFETTSLTDHTAISSTAFRDLWQTPYGHPLALPLFRQRPQFPLVQDDPG